MAINQGEKHGILESCRIRQNLTESNRIQWNPIEFNGFCRLPQDSRIPCFSLGKFKAVLGNPRES